MTEDYKKKVFDYITGNYKIEKPKQNIPIFEQDEERQENIDMFVSDYFNEDGSLFIKGIVEAKTNDNQNLKYNAIYGEFYPYSTGSGTIPCIVILDSNLIPLKVIDKYKSGTRLRYIEDLQVAEDGTLYGIDLEETQTVGEDRYRFIMLNNIFLAINDNFYVDLRYSYNLKASNRWYQGLQKIKKLQEQSKYVIGSIGDGVIGGNEYICAFLLEVNVGSTNTLTRFYETTATDYDINQVQDLYLQEVDSVTYIYMAMCNSDRTAAVFTGNTSTTNPTLSKRTYTTSGYLTYNDFYETDGKMLFFPNQNTIYITTVGGNNNRLYVDKIENNAITNIVNQQITEVNNIEYSLIKQKGNDLFLTFFSTLPGTFSGQERDVFVGMLNDEKVNYYKAIGNYRTAGGSNIIFNINNQYNLYIYSIILHDYSQKVVVYQVYNENNYNGEPYQNFNSLLPNSAIFRSLGAIKFARNIINNSYANNTIMSSVEIPNLYANGIVISETTLLSKTNNEIIDNFSSWEKNLFEDVYVNFIQRYKAINKNETPNIIQPISGGYISNDLVTSLETPEESYQNIKINKYKINYADGTNYVGQLGIKEKQNMIVKYEFTIKVIKEITSIEFISNDENTIYLTIENKGQLETGKNYTLRQDVTIE